MRIFKIGDRVRVISNDAGSSHNIGDIGVVEHVVMYKDSTHTHKHNLGHCGVNTRCKAWANELYFTDLILVCDKLNPNTKVI